MDQNKEIDIDLRKIFFALRRRLGIIILVAVVCGIASGCFTEFFIEPTYSTSATMCVSSTTDRVATNSSITSGEITASQQLVNTYTVVLKSDIVLEKVIEELGIGDSYSASSIASMLTVSQITDSMVFKITVKNHNPELAMNIANAIVDIAPSEIVRIVKAGNAEVVDYAKLPTSPSSPNVKKNIVIAAIIGFTAAFVIFLIYEIFDTTITNEKDLEREFEYPILGSVPRLDSAPVKENKSNTGDEKNE